MTQTRKRGFAAMTPERRKELCTKGGYAVQAKGTAHRWTSAEAKKAGRKGGIASRGGRGKLPAQVTR